jgi:hypothetical protein
VLPLEKSLAYFVPMAPEIPVTATRAISQATTTVFRCCAAQRAILASGPRFSICIWLALIPVPSSVGDIVRFTTSLRTQYIEDQDVSKSMR